MPSSNRPFRTRESYEAERATRDALVPFLRDRNVVVHSDKRQQVGDGESQVIDPTLPDGSRVRMRVRLCWRRDGANPRKKLYSAFQLRARTVDGDWEKTLLQIAERDAHEAISHTLAVQREGNVVTHAALIPSDQIPAIWEKQREISDSLIARGAMGRIRKNHAANGHSPTLWLRDARTAAAHEVPDVLWSWPGVRDLATMPLIHEEASALPDDSWDDLPKPDYLTIGSDGSERVTVQRSSVKRDRLVRTAVIDRANGRCERIGCGAHREFQGFLDVHHVLGVERGDRVWNCVALCPNCHREAHVSPDSERINSELLRFASRFKPVNVMGAGEPVA